MFTGIVQGMAQVESCQAQGRNMRLQIGFPQGIMLNQQLGASVAINGVCLTVAKMEADTLTFDVIDTTLNLTNIGLLQPGMQVNFERAAKIGEEIGGHVMSGHIMSTVIVRHVMQVEESYHIRFAVDNASVDVRRYLLCTKRAERLPSRVVGSSSTAKRSACANVCS